MDIYVNFTKDGLMWFHLIAIFILVHIWIYGSYIFFVANEAMQPSNIGSSQGMNGSNIQGDHN